MFATAFAWIANNKWAQLLGSVILVIIGYEAWKHQVTNDALRRQQDRMDAEARKQLEKANAEVKDRATRAREAAEAVEHELGYTTADLNAEQLRKLTEGDPNNRGRIVRSPEAD